LAPPTCHCTEQGGNKRSGRCSLLPLPSQPGEGKKEEKGRETYKFNIKTALLTILITRQIKYTKLILSFLELGAGVPPGAARQHQAGPDWP